MKWYVHVFLLLLLFVSSFIGGAQVGYVLGWVERSQQAPQKVVVVVVGKSPSAIKSPGPACASARPK